MKILKVLAVSMMLASTVVATHLVYLSLFGKHFGFACVSTMAYGEGWIELLWLLFASIYGCYVVYDYTKHIAQNQ